MNNLADQAYERGIFSYQQRNLNEALTFFNKALETNPNHQFALYEKGSIYLQLGNEAEGLELMKKALNVQHEHILSAMAERKDEEKSKTEAELIKTKAYEKGVNCISKCNYSQAIRLFNKVLKSNPSHAESLLYRGNAFYSTNKFEKAIEDYDKGLVIDPTADRIWASKALALSRIGLYEEAIRNAKEALKLSPNRWWKVMAIIHENFNNIKEAVECIDKTLYYQTLTQPEFGYQRVRLALIDRIKYNENFHIQTYKFPIILLQYVPADEEIVYTSNISITWRYAAGRSIQRRRYTSACFITRRGFICQANRHFYIPWVVIRFFRNGKWKWGDSHSFKLIRNPDTESQEEFDSRVKMFNKIISKLRETT